MDGTNLMRLAELLKMAGKPSHGYTISEAGPEVVTAPGVYFPSKPGEVIPLQSRAEGGPVSPTSSSSDTEKEKLAILRDIISVIKPRQDHGGGMESRQMGGPVSPDGKVPIMDEIEKSKYDIFKAAMSVLKPQKPYNERTSAYGSPSGKSQFSPSLPTTPSLPGLPKPITSSSYGMMPDAFKPSEGEALWQKKRAELGWENPGEDLWTHKRREAGVLDLTSRQYGGFVSPDEEEFKARKRWEIPGYPERRFEEARKILGPSVLGVQPGFQKSYYEAHPEEKLMDEETARMKPLTDAIMKSIEDARTKEQGYGLGFGPTPAERRLGAGRGREQPSEIPGLVTAGALLTPKLTKGILPAGITTPKQPTLSPVGQLMAERDTLPRNDPRRADYDAAIKKATEQPEKDIATSGLREFEIASGTNPSKRGTPEYSKSYMEFLTGKKQATQITDPIQQKKLGTTLRKEFNSLQPVKDYRDIETRFNIMGKAVEESKTTKNFVAVDQALITIFNKMTDPQSVVRESEYLRTPQDLALWNRIKGKVSKMVAGGAGLTPDDRNALFSMAKQFQGAYESKYNQLRNEYRGYAVDYGLDPETVIKSELKEKGAEEESDMDKFWR